MSEQSDATLKVMIDNKKLSNVERKERADVLKAITGYGGTKTNTTPGFYVESDISSLKTGTHTIKIQVYSTEGELMASTTRNFRINRDYVLGIDVSEQQGTINWEKVKADGIAFAILRLGWIGNYDNHTLDTQFETNYKACKNLGIPVGIYVYSYTVNDTAAKSGAKWAIKQLSGKSISLPVFIDVEDSSMSSLSKSQITSICTTFCSTIKSNGRTAGVYASKSWFDNKIDVSKLTAYQKWVAQWNSKCTYEGEYTFWQYSSSGSVCGITTKVDLDRWYK